MNANTLYRKYRPQNFDEVVGQDTVVRILRNQIENNKIGHAYLFSGTRGTGKTTIAKIFARAVNCENRDHGNPCNKCQTCTSAIAGSNLNIVEMDAASNNSIENVRNIKALAELSPVDGEKYKVFIIDEVHSMSKPGLNALLKILEEPPEYIIFILCTTEPEALIDTIRSRCQKYDFHRIEIDIIKNQLKKICDKEGISIDEAALSYIALKGDGSMRDAISLLERCRGFGIGNENISVSLDDAKNVLGVVDNTIFKDLLASLLRQDVKHLYELIGEIVDKGKDLNQFISDFVWFLRNILVVKHLDKANEMLMITIIDFDDLKELSSNIPEETIIYYIEKLSELERKIKAVIEKRVLIETTFLILATPEADVNIKESYMSRISVIEKKMENGSFVAINNNDNHYQDLPTKDISLSKSANKTMPAQNSAPTGPQEMYVDKATFDDVQALKEHMNEIIESFGQGIKVAFNKSTLVPASEKDSGTINIIPPTDIVYETLNKAQVKENIIEKLEENTRKVMKKSFKYKLLSIKKDNVVSDIELKIRGLGVPVETM